VFRLPFSGSPAGKAEGVKYSEAMENADWKWDDEHLRKWMCNSKSAIKEFSDDDSAKTKMPRMRVCDEEKQNEVLHALKLLAEPTVVPSNVRSISGS